jgi:hypothetical protein
MNRQNVGLYFAWLVTVPLLVFAVIEKHPYSFYTVLRWVCCVVFAYSTFIALHTNRDKWIGVFGILAVVFNPIVPVHLQRGTWQVIDLLAAATIVVAAVVFWRTNKQA